MLQFLRRGESSSSSLMLSPPWHPHQAPEFVLRSFLQTAFRKEDDFVITVGFYRQETKAQLSLGILGNATPLLLQDHHLHDEVYEVTGREAEFDATEAGRLGLKRRLMGEKYSRDEYLARLKAAENAPLPEVGEITYPPHEGWQGKEAHGLLPATEVRPAYENRQDPLKKQDQVEVTRLSQEWMEKLTPEEQEAVAWMTSNGSGVLLSHHYGQEHKLWGYDVYDKAHIEQTNELLASATRKGAKLEEPMVVYRGVNMNDEVENFDASTLWQVGEVYSVNTPESSSAAPDVARSHTSFNQPTVYEYEITTACATACVSAWRSSELEFLVPYKKFECVGFHEDVRFGESDTPVRVVQFRELPEASD